MTPTMASDAPEAVALMRDVHRPTGNLTGEFPLVFGADAAGRIVERREGDELRSACAILPRDFVSGGRTVRVGLIGSVSTEPDHRGQGHATQLLDDAERALADAGCAIAMLWANEPEFYYERGYVPVGGQVRALVESSQQRGLPGDSTVRDATSDDAARLHELYSAHPSRVDRSAAETAALLDCPGMSVLVTERDGAITAYACRGRGADLRSIVHEWGGATDDVLALLHAHAGAEAEGAVGVLGPVSEHELWERLAASGAAPVVGFLGLAKVLDRGQLGRTLVDATTPGGVIGTIEDSAGRARVAIRTAEGGFELDDELLLALMFPAFGRLQEVEELAESFGVTFDGVPLELFAWGLDSI